MIVNNKCGKVSPRDQKRVENRKGKKKEECIVYFAVTIFSACVNKDRIIV
jgi:hypothetical protein